MMQKLIGTVLVTLMMVAGSGTALADRVQARLLMADGTQKVGYVGDTNEKGLKFHFSENPSDRGQAFPHSEIRAVSFNEEGDIMAPARAAYSRSRYEEAEQFFREVAEKYENLWGISREQLGNFACEARYFQIDCLRRLGRYDEMTAALESQTGRNLENVIAEIYLPQIKLFRLWEKFAARKWDDLEKGLLEYQVDRSGRAGELITDKALNPEEAPSVLVQIAYMRGKLRVERGEKDLALTDFFRTATLDHGSDRILTRDALRDALAIQAENPSIKESYPLQTEIYAVARVYQEAYNGGEIDAEFREFAREPEMPPEVKAMQEAREKARAEEAAAEKAEAEAKAAAPEAKSAPETAKPAPKKPAPKAK